MDRNRDTTTIDGTPLAPLPPRGTPAIRLDLIRSVRLHPVLAASVAAVTFAVIAGYAITRKPVYKAEALVYVEPITAKVLSDGSDGLFDATRYESYLQQQIQTVQRPDILQAAVESLPIGYWHFPGETTANAATRLGNSLKVERQTTSFQLSLSLMGPDPVSTAAAVNAVTAAYLQKGRKDETARTDGRVQLLQEERDRLTTELQSDRAEQVTLGSTLGVANPVGPTADAYDTDLSGIRSELVAARQAHDIAAAQLASVTGPDNSIGMAALADEKNSADPGLQALKTSFAQRRAGLTTQMAGLTPSNPIYKQDQAELAQLDQQLAFRSSLTQNVSANQLRDRLRLELKRTGEIEARLNGQLAHATALATTAAPKLQRASELAGDIDRLQARYAAVDNALRGLQLESNGPGVVHLSVPATPPTGPEPSRRNLLLLASVPLALLFGGIAAVLARRRAGRVYTEGDLEPILGFTPIGSMPYASSLSSSAASQDLLRLAAGLERAHRRGAVKSFVFTAASASTDITPFVAAMTHELQRLGFRTRMQSTGQLLRSWDAPSSDSEIRIAGIRQGIGARLDALKQRTDFVLLDAPPLLHSAETEYFLSAADITVLLIESGVTTERELNPAMDLLRKLRVGGLAAVLLNVPSESSNYSIAPAVSRSSYREPIQEPANTNFAESATQSFHELISNPISEPVSQALDEPVRRAVPEATRLQRMPDPQADSDLDPEPPRPSKISRITGPFRHERETSNPHSFIPSFHEDTSFAAAFEPDRAQSEIVASAGTSRPELQAFDSTASSVDTIELPPTTLPDAANSSTAAPWMADALTTPVPANEAAASQAPLLSFQSASEEAAPAFPPAKVEAAAPSMLLWQAHIRHRTPTPVAAEQVILAEPVGDSAPMHSSQPQLLAAKAEPAPQAAISAVVSEQATSTIEALIDAVPPAIIEPRRLPSSAERLAFRATNPMPRRPGLSSIPVAQPPIAPSVPQPATYMSHDPAADSRVMAVPRLVPPPRPPQPASRSISAGEVAERIVEFGSGASGSRRNNLPSNSALRPHIMPARVEATAGRRWAMLSRFSKEPSVSAPDAIREPAPRDRAAG